MAKHVHHPECRHNHRHTNECSHGAPTAVPRRRTCGVCARIIQKPWFCAKHRRWECASHKVESHGDGSWIAITRMSMAQARQGVQRAKA